MQDSIDISNLLSHYVTDLTGGPESAAWGLKMSDIVSGKVISRVQIFSSANVIAGMVTHEPGQRLLDLLNTGPSSIGAHEADFLCVNGATVGKDIRQDPLQPIYVNKTNIFFIAEVERDKPERKPGGLYPYVSKETIGIKFYVPAYTLTGKIHYPKGHRPQDVLTSPFRFFPLTEARIFSSSGHHESPVSFIAVNKDQILYVESIY